MASTPSEPDANRSEDTGGQHPPGDTSEQPPVPEPADSAAPPGPDRPAAEGDEAGDIARLQARITVLETASKREHHRLRTSGAVVLIVLASLLSLLSVLAVWTANFVGDTNRYVQTVAPLATEPDIQQAVTNRVTTVVLDQIDVNALVKQLSDAAAQQGVPPNAANLINNLSGPIESGLTQLVSSTVHQVVTSDAFATIWVNANRQIHSALDKALTGSGGGTVNLQNNQVTIDIAPIVAKVKDQLVSSGFGAAAKIPDVHTDFVVFASQDIGKIKTYFRLLEIMGDWLPVVTVLIAAGGVLLAVDRRRALIGAAVGVALAMLLLGVVLTVFRAFYLDRLPPGADHAAAGTVYDTLVRFMRASVRAVGTAAVVTAVGAFLIGPSRPAVAVRTACSRLITSVRDALYSLGMRLGPVGPFVHRWKRWIGVTILVAAAAILATWSYPTWAVVLWLTFFTALAFAIREFLDTGPDADRTAPTTTPGGPTPRQA